MHVHRLSMQAVGPYPDQHTINFDDFEASGKFLLSGPTGSGKTTIIDAIVFALYGNVADDDSSTDRIRSTFADPSVQTVVTMEFSTPNGMFRIRRTPSYMRPKKRGTGLIKENATATMCSIHDVGGPCSGDPLTRIDEISRRVLQVVGLTREQFTQTVVLPQGKFAKFLRSSSEERHDLLRDVFGTVTYDTMQHYLEDQSKEARRRTKEADTAVSLTLKSFITMLEGFDAADTLHDRDGYASLMAVANGESVSLPWCEGSAHSAGSATLAPSQRPLDSHRSSDGDNENHPDHLVSGDPVSSSSDRPASPSLSPSTSVPPCADLSDYLHRLTLRQRLTDVSAFLEHRVKHAQEIVTDVQCTHHHAQQRLESARDIQSRQERLARLRVCLEDLQSKASQMEEVHLLIDRAQRAQRVIDSSRSFERATEELALMHNKVSDLRSDPYADKFPDVLSAQDTDGLSEVLAELNEDIANLKSVLKQADSLDSLLTQVQKSQREVEEKRAAYDAALQAANDLPLRRDALEQDKATQQIIADGLEHALDCLTKAKEQDAAAQEVVSLDEQIAAIQPDYEHALEQHNHLLEAKSAIHQQWIDAQASLLAQSLEDNCPCPVCGSHQHPSPAHFPDDENISQERVNDVDEAFDQAQARTHHLSSQIQALTLQRERARKASGGISVDKASDALKEATLHYEQCTAAAQKVKDRDHDLKKLADEEKSSVTSINAAKDDWLAATHEATLAQHKHDETKALIDDYRGEFASVHERYQEVTAHHAWAQRVMDTFNRHRQATENLAQATDDLSLVCQENGYDCLEAAHHDALTPDDLARHTSEYTAYTTDLKVLKQQIDDPSLTEADQLPAPDCQALSLNVDRCRQQEEAAAAVLSTVRSQQDAASSLIEQLNSALDDAEQSRADHADLIHVASVVAGDNTQETSLGTWVLMNRFEDVVSFANDRLMSMSNGRYSLRRVHRETGSSKRKGHGLGLEVIDLFSDNEQARDPRTLSGGETFYVSLSLALALGDVVSAESGGIRLETLFIDEGFGSLDPHTLAAVMHELDRLREGGRIIGVVSHVDELKREIADRIEVVSTEHGSTLSVIAGT